jgi:hypothetical protein
MIYVCVGAESGARAVIRIYGSAELEPKEIFTALQHSYHFSLDTTIKQLFFYK